VPLFNFGGPVGGMIQTAFIVEDMRESIARFVQDVKIGPWFLRERNVFPKQTYRGRPSHLELSIAFSFCGSMMMELIQQHNDEPSVYREVIAKRGYGLHHWGIAAEHFDQVVAGYVSRGYELAYEAEVAPGVRVGYVDTTAHLPAMVEVIEMKPAQERMFTLMQQAAVGWDGRDPVRPRPAFPQA